jgi:nucleotide-binding universal stress UspA family protein
MKKILVPLDGSDLAEKAIQPAARLAGRHEAGLVLASVVSDLPPVPLAAGDGEMVSAWFKEEEERSERYLAKIRGWLESSHPGISVETRVELGPVARTLIAMSDDVDADLVVITTHGRGAWQRAWLGSVADGIIRGATRPVLLIREGEESEGLFAHETSPSHVLIPLDGSKAAQHALDPVTSLLPSEGGRVTLVTVLLRPFPLATTYLPHTIEEGTLLEERKKRAEQHLREVAERWNPLGVRLETRVLTSDDVAKALLDFTEESDADLVALSTRGRGGVARFVMGSVADKIVRGSGLPVLAVRRPAPEG